ncbi:hypothetical protein FOZ62_019568, partial [Perkinsus olseni]
GDRNLAIGVEKITTDTPTECSPSPNDWYGYASSPATSAGSSAPSNTCSSPEEDSEDEARVTSPSTSSAFGAFDYNLSAVRLALRRILLVMIAGPDYTSEDGTWPHEEDLPEEVWRSPGPWTSREEFLKIISHVMDDAGLTSSSQARSLD